MNDFEVAIAVAAKGAAVVRRCFGTTLDRLDKGAGDFATNAVVRNNLTWSWRSNISNKISQSAQILAQLYCAPVQGNFWECADVAQRAPLHLSVASNVNEIVEDVFNPANRLQKRVQPELLTPPTKQTLD